MHTQKIGARGKKITESIRALVKLARLAEYELKWVPGHNGECYFWLRKIEMGRDLPMTEKLVVLAHEIGHVFDYTNSFPQVEELTMMFEFPDQYSLGPIYFDREKKAWDYAEYLLNYIGILSTIQTNFQSYKTKSLGAYRSRMYRAKRSGASIPDKKEYDKALIKWKEAATSDKSAESRSDT